MATETVASKFGPVPFSMDQKDCQWDPGLKINNGAGSTATLEEAVAREWPPFQGREGAVFVPEEYFLSKVPEVIDPDYENREGFQSGDVVMVSGGLVKDKQVLKMDKKYKGE